MHRFTPEVEELAREVLSYSLERLKSDPPLDGPRTSEDLFKAVGNTITEKGLGGKKALEIFTEVLAKACISTDHPRNLAFIPSAPTEYANLFDLVVGASALYGGSWQEGSGAVFAENQALRWISDLAIFPKDSGGVFVQGGTIGNLSALVVAREHARNKYKENKKWVIICSNQSHSSIVSAAKIMDVEIFLAEPNRQGKLTGEIVLNALNEIEKDSNKKVFAIVATPGTTNLGIIDELENIGKIANERNIWYHVDGAYGLAALCAPSVRNKFNGIELADSLIVDPHKWLFAPFDACALIYKDPKLAKETHMQKATYLETLHDDLWNPSDYAINLTRRTRGLPFWFSLSAYGTNAYSEAMEQTLTIAKEASELVKQHPNLTLLMEPELSIVAFERKGWQKEDYDKWSEKLLNDQIGFIPPSSHKGKPILRFAIVNPWTKIEDIKLILDTL